MAPTPDRSRSAGRDPDEAAGERCAPGGTPTALRSSLLYGKLFDEPGDRLTPTQLNMRGGKRHRTRAKQTFRASRHCGRVLIYARTTASARTPILNRLRDIPKVRLAAATGRVGGMTIGGTFIAIVSSGPPRSSDTPPIRMRDLIGVTFSVLLLMWASECCLAWHHTATRVEEERTCTEVSCWARPSLSVR